VFDAVETYTPRMDLDALPGSELIREGLEDLRAGRETATALLVVIGAPRLRQIGIDVPPSSVPDRSIACTTLALTIPTPRTRDTTR